MKSKFLIGLLLCLMLKQSSYGQYDYYDINLMMLQNQITEKHEYNCYDGKNIVCLITIVRMSGFQTYSAVIQNINRTKSQAVKITSLYYALALTIGESDWLLQYGDHLLITIDGNITRTFDVGIDDKMSEIDWNRYSDQLKNNSKQQIQNNINNYNAQQYNNSINSNTNNNSNSNIMKLVSEKCSFCKGTGISPVPTAVPSYGITDLYYCEYCKQNVTASHGAHLSCPRCNGIGVIKKYKY